MMFHQHRRMNLAVAVRAVFDQEIDALSGVVQIVPLLDVFEGQIAGQDLGIAGLGQGRNRRKRPDKQQT